MPRKSGGKIRKWFTFEFNNIYRNKSKHTHSNKTWLDQLKSTTQQEKLYEIKLPTWKSEAATPKEREILCLFRRERNEKSNYDQFHERSTPFLKIIVRACAQPTQITWFFRCWRFEQLKTHMLWTSTWDLMLKIFVVLEWMCGDLRFSTLCTERTDSSGKT